MISSFRNFAKTKFAGLLVFIMIIPFVFWGMGSMFSSGNTNTIAKINNESISTQEFIDYLNNSGIPQKTIRDNLNNNIIEELLSNLISTKLIELEVKNFNVIISEKSLLKKIKENKNFQGEDGNFERIKYEKFLLENNQSAPAFELRLRGRELQKHLFDYIGAGTTSPNFLVAKLFKNENRKLEIDFINLNNFYKKRDSFTQDDLEKFVEKNKDQLKVEYLNFDYTIINPKNLIGIDEFNQSFFDKIDQIEADIANGLSFEIITNNLNLPITKKIDFKLSSDSNEIEKKIYASKNNDFDILENNDDFVLYKINEIYEKEPNLKDNNTKKEIVELIHQKKKFEYNKQLLEKITNNEFSNKDFLNMSEKNIETIKLNSIKDNKKFEINSVEILYSIPLDSFTLISDEKKNIYIAKVKKFEDLTMSDNNNQLNNYINKQNSNMKKNILGSYDLYLNKKYEIDLNQKTIERVKNFFQ
jgi:peptidyl-prolyl cis-trans isomerase D